MAAPLVFISYSHDSLDHKTWVLKLATDLRGNGIDVTLDQWDLCPGQDMVVFMEHGITKSDRVILVCSDNYLKKAEGGSGGVGYERLIASAEVVSDARTKKFVPILRGLSNATRRIPSFLGSRLYVDFSADREYEVKLDELSRELLGTPKLTKPPLGQARLVTPVDPQQRTRASYVVVLTQEPCEIFIDDQSQGANTAASGRPRALFVSTGRHIFRLGSYGDYPGASRTCEIPERSILDPFVIDFNKSPA